MGEKATETAPVKAPTTRDELFALALELYNLSPDDVASACGVSDPDKLVDGSTSFDWAWGQVVAIHGA